MTEETTPELLNDDERELLDEKGYGDQIKQGYYIGFDATGVPAVDRILAALGHAGKGYHHTENWNEELEYGTFAGSSYAEVIQRAANEAAAEIRGLAADRAGYPFTNREDGA